MNDEELLRQAAAVGTMYFDGFGAFRKLNGVLRGVGFTIEGGAQLNLIVSLIGAEATNAEVRRILSGPEPKPTLGIQRMRLHH